MLQIDNYLYATDLAEAYDTLQSIRGSVVLGGCGYIRLGSRSISTAIDLSKLGLDFIRKVNGTIEIGAMTTLRSFETDPLLFNLATGVLKSSVENIVGVQLRNTVTLGGTIAGRYPFSDPITALLALDTQLKFYNHGQVSLTEYLDGKGYKDILEKIIIPDDGRIAAFSSIRKSATDYAVLNSAVSRNGNAFRIIVGSRPGRAVQAVEAQEFLQGKGLNENTAAEAGRITAEHLQFGDNPRGSAEYRKAVCPVLVQRGLMEVIHAA